MTRDRQLSYLALLHYIALPSLIFSFFIYAHRHYESSLWGNIFNMTNMILVKNKLCEEQLGQNSSTHYSYEDEQQKSTSVRQYLFNRRGAFYIVSKVHDIFESELT